MYKNIEAERARNQMTKAEISTKLKISQSTYNNYINDVSPIPSDVLVEMANLFKCSTDYLLGLTDEHWQ